MKTLVRCARALCAGVERNDFAMLIEDDRFADAGAYAALRARYPAVAQRTYGHDVVVVPGFVNGHSHAYQILLRGWADDLPFETWRREALYAIVPQLSPDDVYWTFLLAFSEMLAAGITTVTEFFYLNGAGNAHAEAAIGAARDAGIRLILARSWMDVPSAPTAFRETIELAASRTRDLMDAHPEVNICVAPHSLHAASHEMIAAAMEFARGCDCLVHIHVAEAEYEGVQTLERYGATPICLLDRLGVLNERLVAIHSIYVTADEQRLLAERGARVVHNPLTNQYLGDGICDVTELQRLGVPTALGTDADVKPSILDEMRAASLLQKIARRDGGALGAAVAFDLGTAQGARALGIPAGDLRAGLYADYAVLDVRNVDPWSSLRNAVVYRAESSWVRETYVGGRRVWNEERSAATQRAKAKTAALMASLRERRRRES